MKLKIRKDRLLECVNKAFVVATRSPKADYDMIDKVTVTVGSDEVLFETSNGHLDMRCKVLKSDDANIVDGTEEGQFTVKASKFREFVKNLPTDSLSSPLILEEDGDMLKICDAARKSRKAKMSRDSRHFDFKIPSVPKSESFVLEQDFFSRALSKVAPFAADPTAYKVKYTLACMHFLKNETRFVCGNATVFSVFGIESVNDSVKDDEGVMKVLPCSQALIVRELTANANKITFAWDKKSEKCHVCPDNGVEIFIKGIPTEAYPAYHNHAYRMGDAKAIVDVPVNELGQALGFVASCSDKDKSLPSKELTLNFDASQENLKLIIDEGSYQSEFDIRCDYFKVGSGGTDLFSSRYLLGWLSDIVSSSDSEYLRFYCLDEKGITIAQSADLLDKKDDDGLPIVKENDDKTKHSFFFTAVIVQDN